MRTFVCRVCGHVAFEQAPVDCPVCKAPIENFDNNPEAIHMPEDPSNLSETEKKHIPMIVISKECRLITSGECVDIHVKVGEIEHVLDEEYLKTKSLFVKYGSEINCGAMVIFDDLIEFIEHAADMCADTADYILVLSSRE